MNEPPLLVWSDRSHWAPQARPCIHCRGPTNLRDDNKKPSHKVCAEQALNSKE